MKPFIAGLATVLVALPLAAAVDTNSPAPDFTLTAQSGKLVRTVPPGDAAPRQHLQEIRQARLHHDRRQRGTGLQGRQRLAEADSRDLSDPLRYRQQGE